MTTMIKGNIHVLQNIPKYSSPQAQCQDNFFAKGCNFIDIDQKYYIFPSVPFMKAATPKIN